ncbi:MAG: cellulase family glycosylhydrolase [Myxococcales bacterium]|nr:cellulase family glycosylhydrolase [Myxococcales bacterium]
MSTDPHSTRGVPFRLGLNYWPARTAMGWWTTFDLAEVATDFGRIAGCGFDSVRIFLTWEDFQPTPSRVDSAMVDRLVATLDEASTAGLSVMPTLFTGHMSGVNWIPSWALGEEASNDRFRVVSRDRITASRLTNWYSDASIIRAQSALAREVAGALAGHRALWAWDLGNENSNCAVPPDKAHAREWLLRVTDAIRGADADALVTLGLHMEDLEQDRSLGPREAAEVCDFLQMHGYPGYASWADGPTDERVLPFLARLTRWLGGGADVLFAEFGVPTKKRGDPAGERSIDASGPALVDEQAAASYIDRALGALLECGTMGAMLWCYSDYAGAIWGLPPLDLAVHERSFGLWRADASPKPAVAMVEAFAKRSAAARAGGPVADSTWIDLDAADFYRTPGSELPRLYRRYCEAISALNGAPANVNEPG